MSQIQWGNGRAPLLEPITKEDTETIVFLSDIHVPYQDDALIDSTIKLIKAVKPHRVIINGDTQDFFSISRFNKNLERLDDLQSEIDTANTIRLRLRRSAPNAQIIDIPGNHCIRLTNYVRENARALASLEALEPSNLFRFKELEIIEAMDCGVLIKPDFLCYHGSVIRQGSGATAKAELLKHQINGLSGHCHRLATFFRNGYTPRSWSEGGCLCRLDPDYQQGIPDWLRGVVVGQFSTTSERFQITLVPEGMDGGLQYGNRTY